MDFYRQIKKEFGFEKYLNIANFTKRKAIIKLRCSDHQLAIEKGRHMKIPREERLCKLCGNTNIETEEHFLIQCKFYECLKVKQGVTFILEDLFNNENLVKLGEYLITAFDKRKVELQT